MAATILTNYVGGQIADRAAKRAGEYLEGQPAYKRVKDYANDTFESWAGYISGQWEHDTDLGFGAGFYDPQANLNFTSNEYEYEGNDQALPTGFYQAGISHNHGSSGGSGFRRNRSMPHKPSRRTTRTRRTTRVRKSAKSIAKVVSSELARRTETKMRILSIDNTGPNTVTAAGIVIGNYTGNLTAANYLNLVNQGSDYNQRTGSQIKEISLEIRGQVAIGPVATTNVGEGCVRIIVFRDKDNRAAQPAFGDIIDVNNVAPSTLQVGAGVLARTTAMPYWENRKRFSILYDACVDLQGQSSEGVKTFKDFHIFLKLGKTLTFQSNGNTYGALVDGGILCAAVADFNGTLMNSPTITFTSRFMYKFSPFVHVK